jgi:hypothetical protein
MKRHPSEWKVCLLAMTYVVIGGPGKIAFCIRRVHWGRWQKRWLGKRVSEMAEFANG